MPVIRLPQQRRRERDTIGPTTPPPTAAKLADRLAYPPRGLRAPRAAAYLGMSESSFLTLVAEGRMPRPKRVKGMNIWDRVALDRSFERLGADTGDEPLSPQRRNTADQAMGLDTDDY